MTSVQVAVERLSGGCVKASINCVKQPDRRLRDEPQE